MCSKCGVRQASHRTLDARGTIELCCECHVGEGNSPADWHPRCMAAYEAKRVAWAAISRMEYRACVDCKWFARGDDGLTCTNPLYSEFDPVHGWLAQPAQQVRRHTGLLCGPSGKGLGKARSRARLCEPQSNRSEEHTSEHQSRQYLVY